MSDDAVREKVRLYVDDVTPAHLPPFAGVAVHRRRQQTRRILATGTTVVLVLAAVLGGLAISRSSGSSATGQTASRLAGTSWRLATVTTNGATWTAPADSRWSLAFARDSYLGNDGCNSVSGKVSYGPATVTLSSGATTDIGCIGSDLDRPRQAMSAIQGHPVSVLLQGQTLTLTTPTALLTLARKETAAQPTLMDQLVGTRWMLRSATVDGKEVPKANDYGASLTFAKESYAYDDGCNAGGGPVGYLTDAVMLTTGSGSTADCPERHPVMEAQQYAGRFGVKLDGTTLTLSSSSHTYIFDAQDNAAFASQLVGTKWHLTSWSFNRSVHDIAAGSSAGIEFLNDIGRSVELTDGCNRLGATASFEAATLRLAELGAAHLACPHENVGLRNAYARLMSQPITTTVTPTELTLAGGGVVLQLTSVTAELPTASPAPESTAPPSEALKKALEGPVWQLLMVDGPGAGTGGHWSVPKAASTLVFGETTWDAYDGCNDWGGSLLYGVGSGRGGAVLMHLEGGSAVGCEETLVQRLEKLIRRDLDGAVSVAVTPSGLVLSHNGDRWTFGPSAPKHPYRGYVDPDGDLTPVLQEWNWVVQSWTENGKTTTGSGSTLVFNFQTASNSGCGAMTATVGYRGDSVTFTRGPIPAVACGRPSPQNAFIDLFSGGAEVSLSGTTLTLSGNGLVMTFTAGTSRFAS